MLVDDLLTIENEKKFNDFKITVAENRSNLEIFNSRKKIELSNILEAPGWDSIILSPQKRTHIKPNLDIKNKARFSKAIISYLFLLLTMSALLFLSLKINEYNEAKLFSNLSIPSRFFTWLDSSESNFFSGIDSQENISEKNFLEGRNLKREFLSKRIDLMLNQMLS